MRLSRIARAGGGKIAPPVRGKSPELRLQLAHVRFGLRQLARNRRRVALVLQVADEVLHRLLGIHEAVLDLLRMGVETSLLARLLECIPEPRLVEGHVLGREEELLPDLLHDGCLNLVLRDRERVRAGAGAAPLARRTLIAPVDAPCVLVLLAAVHDHRSAADAASQQSAQQVRGVAATGLAPTVPAAGSAFQLRAL